MIKQLITSRRYRIDTYRINNLIVETQVKVLKRKWYRGIPREGDGTAADIDSSCDSSEKFGEHFVRPRALQYLH